MGKILLTNCKEWNNDLQKIFDKTGFFVSGKTDIMTVYKKRKVNNENFWKYNDNYVASAGTLIYKGEMGRKALELIYNDSKKKDIKELRKNFWGTYTCVIKRNDIIKIFVDETETYALYYHNDDTQKYLVTNTYYHIAKCIKTKLIFEALLEKGIRGGIYGNVTPYKNVFRLKANEYIEINLNYNKFRICETELNDYRKEFKNKEEAIEILRKNVEKIEKAYSKNVKGHVIFATGGLDSRLELALHLKNQKDISLGYWSGGDSLTNGTLQDMKIGKRIAQKEDLKYIYYDVSEEFKDSINSINEEKCDEFGEYTAIYAHNKKWFQILNSFNPSVQSLRFGYGGELIRGTTEVYELKKKHRNIDDFIRHVYCRAGIEKKVILQENIYQTIKEGIASCFKINDYSIPLTLEECEMMFDYSRFHADCNINALINMYYYSCPIFMDKKSWDIICSMKLKWKENNAISIKLLKKWNEGLLDIPIYSHHHIMKYDKNRCELRDTLKYKMLKFTQMSLVNTKVYDVIYVKWLKKRLKPHTEKNQELLDLCIKRLVKSPTIISEDVKIKNVKVCKGFDVTALAEFVAQICVADVLKSVSY